MIVRDFHLISSSHSLCSLDGALLLRLIVLEYQHGAADRGRQLMEQLLADHSKRHDFWLVYVDQQVKLIDSARDKTRALAECRALLERACALPWSLKQMKILFQRWLAIEKAHGDASSQQLVKQRALAFAKSQQK